MAEEGAKIAATMVRRCHELDPTRVVSAAVNGDNEKGVSDAFDIIGFNYNLNCPDDYHKEHPKRPIYGSETASAISTRGVYSTDPLRNTVSAYDVSHPAGARRPKSGGSSTARASGRPAALPGPASTIAASPRPTAGPPSTRSSASWTCADFPRTPSIYYKAWWGKEPSLHLFPHWNFEGREGDEIPVWVYSNLDEVELFVNGKSPGSQKVPHLGHVEWKVKYEPGAIEARGSKDGKVVLTEKRETTGPAVAIRLTADRTEINADGEDVAILKVEALDKEGRAGADGEQPHRLQSHRRGRADRRRQRRSQLPGERQGAQALALQWPGAGDRASQPSSAGEIHIEAVKEGWDGPELTPAQLTITTKKAEKRPAVPIVRE